MGSFRRLMILELNDVAGLGRANPSHLDILCQDGVQEGRVDVVVSSVCREVLTEGISIMAIIVSWIDKCPLGADSDTVLLFLGLLVAWLWGPITAAGCDCGP
jgi:hypothetical protein